MPEPSNVARVAHNLGLASWFGGALFGQVALNPTISRISDRRERGRVLNESWGRFNAVTFATIAASILTWRLGELREDAELRAPALARIKNLLLGGAVINGIASGFLGARIAKEGPGDAPEGGTPVEAGTQPAPETPEEAAQAQRLISITGPSALSLLATVIALSAIIDSSAVKPRGILPRLFLWRSAFSRKPVPRGAHDIARRDGSKYPKRWESRPTDREIRDAEQTSPSVPSLIAES